MKKDITLVYLVPKLEKSDNLKFWINVIIYDRGDAGIFLNLKNDKILKKVYPNHPYELNFTEKNRVNVTQNI